MANGYMPRPDVLALRWVLNFTNKLVEHPEIYHVSPEQVMLAAEAAQAFADAYRLTQDPVTRTRVTIAAKDHLRVEAELACRPLYAQIKADPRIDNADKLIVGVRPMNPARTRIQVADSEPDLRIDGITTSSHILRFLAPHQLGSAKPRGATQIQLFRALTREINPDAGEFRYLLSATRNPIRIGYTAIDDLKIATYRARWINRRGETGPWSQSVSLRVSTQSSNVSMQKAA